ncbi:MAG TPA: PQQ-dependent sugar dehydrogenase [Methanomassiliicoccaceae archaeon]|nr:PQQ-dependent sugar dehydrogenase [Methanomassiliicoccaceae archaeon]HPT74411.1 PQQ-dependent sugar dehydrogenase [Methanomassiliicoccaceae archaeon]
MERGSTISALTGRSVTVGLETVIDELVNPVAMACPDDGSGRMFIVDQIGKVHLLSEEGSKIFLDIGDEMVELDPGYDERGLLGMALHPRFPDNGKFYLYYNAPPEVPGWNSTSILAEYVAEGDAKPRRVRTVLKVQQPQMNHNGGHITFGPDGLLYIPLGDGGGQNDRGIGHNPATGNGQDLNVLLGKILRIDVDDRSEGREYGIPPDNPFADGGGLPEIYAYGLRNPYHISFDRETGRLFAGDVGQTRWEEVDIIVKGGNYGWNIREGRHCFNPEDNRAEMEDCPDRGARGEKLIDPILEYPNAANRRGGIGTAVIGGYIYRGGSMPHLRGRYIFGDLSGRSGRAKGKLFIGTEDDEGRWTMEEMAIHGRRELGEYVLAFGEDAEGELYVMTSMTEGPSGSSGRVQRIVPPGA